MPSGHVSYQPKLAVTPSGNRSLMLAVGIMTASVYRIHFSRTIIALVGVADIFRITAYFHLPGYIADGVVQRNMKSARAPTMWVVAPATLSL